MQLSKPLLPANFIRQVESDPMMSGYPSAVYERQAHDQRLAMRNWLKPLSPDYPVIGPTGFTVEAKRTALHLAAMDADVLAVSELLRLGASADKADGAGITPLYLAISKMDEYKSVMAQCPVDGTVAKMMVRSAEMGLSRRAWVARILIEQHADVNRSINGVSLLDLACIHQSWDTISLLLKHGANPSPSPASHFPRTSDKSRFFALAKSIGTGHPRPPRLCPCWSGKTVSACHGKEKQPYPLEFVCVCGSGKTYGRCCHSRKSPVIEKWDNKTQRILHDFDHVSKFPEPMRDRMKDVMAVNEQFVELGQRLGMESPRFDVVKIQEATSAALLSKGLIDPAFAYAMRRVDFTPKPQGRSNSRHLCERMQERWNALVDEYILQSGDQRSRWEIERTAKIGTWNGALIRVCEGIACEAVEGRDVEKLKLCSRCKIAVYCGSECQRSAWTTHKAICGSNDQLEQSLPSQDAIKKHIVQKQINDLKAYDISGHRKIISQMLGALTTDDYSHKNIN